MGTITLWLEQYGIWAILLIIFLEYACFPVSSEIVLPLAGYIAASTKVPFLMLTPLSVIAGLLGTSVCFFLGKIGGERLLNYLMRRFPKTRKGIERSCEYFKKRGPITVCVLRVVPLCRTYIAFAAGAFSMDYRLFLSASLLGITFWNSILIAAGFQLGDHFTEVSAWYQTYKYTLLVAILLAILAYLSVRYLIKRLKSKTDDTVVKTN